MGLTDMLGAAGGMMAAYQFGNPTAVANAAKAYKIGGDGTPAASQLGAAGYNTGVNPDALAAIQAQRKQQQQLAAMQLAGAQGAGPSAAAGATTAATNAAVSGQLAAAGSNRFGMNPAQAAYAAAGNAANLEGQGAAAIGATRAGEMQNAQLGANATLGSMNQAATNEGQLAQEAQMPVAQLASNEEAQRSGFGQQMYGGMLNGFSGSMQNAQNSMDKDQNQFMQLMGGGALGGGGGMAMAAHGAVARGVRAKVGEHGPEILLPLDGGTPRLIDHPMATIIGLRRPEAVLPLRPGSAPYHSGPFVPGRPTQPAPAGFAAEIKPEALRALAGGKEHSPGGGAEPLDPGDAPAIIRALAAQPRAMVPALSVTVALRRHRKAA